MANHAHILKYLQKGERILLYAYGKNGKQVYQYLKEQPQFQVIGIVDRNADSLTDIGVPVYAPDQLRTLAADMYDKIIITVMSQAMGLEVYQIIKESGAAEEKIAAPYTYLGPFATLSVENMLQTPMLLQQEIEAYILQPNNNLLYFDPLIRELEQKGEEKEKLLVWFKKMVHSLTPLENIVLFDILYLAGIFDAELMKHMMECLLRIDQKELRQLLYGISSDTTDMCFTHPEFLFPEFYSMRRTLLRNICRMYDLHMRPRKTHKGKDGKIRKICIISHMLYDQKSSATLFSIQLSGMLADMGYEIMVMPLDVCGYPMSGNPVLRPIIFANYKTSREHEAYHKAIYHPKVLIEYTDETALQEKMQIELDKLAEFSPDLIIDMTDEHSVLSYVYSQYFTTLYIPMRGYQSSSFFTYFAVRDMDGFLRENSIYHSVKESCAVEYSAFYLWPSIPTKKYEREELSIGKSDFVLITVGNRLNTEMTEEFIDAVCKNLLDKPNIKWLIVGSENEYLSQNYANFIDAQKIQYISYEDDLPALYEVCDLYLNPKRMGGGTSIVWAMRAGLPIALLSCPCDVMTIIGYENAAGDTYEQMMEYILSLWKDPACFRRECEKFQNIAVSFEERLAQKVQAVVLQVERLENSTHEYQEKG